MLTINFHSNYWVENAYKAIEILKVLEFSSQADNSRVYFFHMWLSSSTSKEYI